MRKEKPWYNCSEKERTVELKKAEAQKGRQREKGANR